MSGYKTTRMVQKIIVKNWLKKETSKITPIWKCLTIKKQKVAVFWAVAPCCLLEVYHEAISPDDGGSKDSETSVNIY
jgi:hypothetical protein